MRHALLLLTLSTVSAAVIAAACNGSVSSAEEGPDAGEGGAPPTIPSTTNTGTPPASGGAGTGLATGLPCDVQGVIENRCIACHGTQGGPPALLTYEQLVAPSTKDPTKSRALVSLAEMQAKTMPPPPAVAPEDDEIAAFDEWIKAGTPKNPQACTDPPPIADGGAGGLADGGVVCTSGKTWTAGDEGPTMHPGAACNACHQQNDGPNLRIAGTVYPTLHEPNDCYGSAPPPRLTVVITDSRNQTVRIAVNEVGNFSTRQRVRPPFKAVVTDGTKTRAMNGSVTSGDCNSCHTTAGLNGAPGRIMAP